MLFYRCTKQEHVCVTGLDSASFDIQITNTQSLKRRVTAKHARSIDDGGNTHIRKERRQLRHSSQQLLDVVK